MKDFLAKLQIRSRERFGNTPFEAVDQAVGYSVKFLRGTVAGEYQLLVMCMQVVEYGKQRARALGTGQFLKIVEQQAVHRLEIIDELGNAAVFIKCHMLIHVLKLTHGHEQHASFRISLLDSDADGLDQMSLADTYIAIKEKWIEFRFFRIVCNVLSDGEGNFIRLSYAIILEREFVVELRIEIVALVLNGSGFGLTCHRTGE